MEVDANAQAAAGKANPRPYFPPRPSDQPIPKSVQKAREIYLRLKAERDTQLLARIVAPWFVADIIIQGNRCVWAAPKLAWTVGRDRDWLRERFARNGWKASIVSDKAA